MSNSRGPETLEQFVAELGDSATAATVTEAARRGELVVVSVGVALARGTDPISPEELLKEADRSLYKAKQQGRNRVFA